MKKYLLSTLAAIALICTTSCRQNISLPPYGTLPTNYLTIDQVVNSKRFLPLPPDSTSARWAYDVERYQWGKTLRDTDRGLIALTDAVLDEDGLARAFSEAFGMEISRNGTPRIYSLITHVREDAGDLATRAAKQHYFRPRPFVVFNEHTPLPKQEAELINNGSYPSGHAAIGMAVAMVLAEVNPSRATEIMKRGYDIGESRIILGFHFDSDVQAGRLCGSMVISSLHNNPEFLKDMRAAQREYRNLTR